MITLISIIPDVDVLLALASEELAERILRLAYERRRDLTHFQSIAADIYGNPESLTAIPKTTEAMPSWQWQKHGIGCVFRDFLFKNREVTEVMVGWSAFAS